MNHRQEAYIIFELWTDLQKKVFGKYAKGKRDSIVSFFTLGIPAIDRNEIQKQLTDISNAYRNRG